MDQNKITTPQNIRPEPHKTADSGGGPWREFFDALPPSDEFPAKRGQPPMQERDFDLGGEERGDDT